MSKGKRLTRGSPHNAEEDLKDRKFIPYPVPAGKEIHLFYAAPNSPNIYVRWADSAGRNGYQQQTTGKTTIAEALPVGMAIYAERSGTKEASFGEKADAYLAAGGKRMAEKTRLVAHLKAAFGAQPISTLYGRPGLAAILKWHNERRTWATDEKGEVVEGGETLYRYAREVRYIVKSFSDDPKEWTKLPKRPKGSRAVLHPVSDRNIISRHLRRRCRRYQPGTYHHHGRLMLWAYARLLSAFSGRTGTEMFSLRFDGIKVCNASGKKKLTLEVDGKTGRDIRIAPYGLRHLIAFLRRHHPDPRPDAHLFVTHRGVPLAAGYHKVFRKALKALEKEIGEPGKFTARWMPKQKRDGKVSLYSMRHGLITREDKRNRPRAVTATAFGTSVRQMDATYSQVSLNEALTEMDW